jgi:hypothetical protein
MFYFKLNTLYIWVGDVRYTLGWALTLHSIDYQRM